MKILYSILLVLCMLGCSSSQEELSDAQETGKSQTAMIPESWIEERVSAAQQRLQASPAGQKIWQAIEAHGGLAQWYANGPLQFHFDYQPLDGKTPRNTIQISDNWSAKARHKMATDTTLQFGWDGQQAWALPDTSKIPFDVRFWALTPYYFVSIPFVLADEGVYLEEAGQNSLEGTTYDLVKVTFGENVGDAPDDYYVIYLHPESRQVGAYRYVVSYPAYFPEGGHTPEKIMVLDGEQTVEGIIFPESYRTFMWKDDKAGEHVTNVTLSDIHFRPDLSNEFFDTPTAAQAITEM